MQSSRKAESQIPAFTLNRSKLDELRRANGIETEAELARILHVNAATLYRITSGKTLPSNGFMARVKLAFPHVKFEDLFSLKDAA